MDAKEELQKFLETRPADEILDWQAFQSEILRERFANTPTSKELAVQINHVWMLYRKEKKIRPFDYD